MAHLRIAISLVFAVVLLHMATALPVKKRAKRQWFPGQITVTPPSPDSECREYNASYCIAAFGYQYARFPNHRDRNEDRDASESYENAQREFGDWAPLLASQCSNKLGTLLCYHYFPQCFSPSVYVTPCKETCEEVRRSCGPILTAQGRPWPEHLNCDDFRLRSSLFCADGPAPTTASSPSSPPSSPPPTATPPPTDGNNTSTEGTTNTMATPTAAPTTTPPPDCDRSACGRCNIRSNANAGTFKRNCYSFAAKVEIVGNGTSGGNRTYDVRVIQPFQLESPTIPSRDVVTIHSTTRACCDACPNVHAGQVCLFAGYHKVSEDGEDIWFLDDKDSLASVYVSKYDRKMTEWVAEGLALREQRNLCSHS